MAESSTSRGIDFRTLLKTGLGVPLGVLGVLAMVVLPLPPLALDALFTFNIALSIVIVMSVFYVARPVEFGVFPTILLIATLLRLALNVASTRVVLLNGHTGAHAAGHVIESFGQFVIGGNFAVGVVVFIILTIINFVVVTKGSGRISEVSARFTLDAMPGTRPITPSRPAATPSAFGERNSWRFISPPMSCEPDMRVTMIATAVESSSAGICVTRPSPIVSSVYVRPAVANGSPWPIMPMARPPIMLMNRIRMPAMASPRTN
jgi:hypothetical protein